MKNVTTSVKLYRVLKTSVLALTVLLIFLPKRAFTNDNDLEEKKSSAEKNTANNCTTEGADLSNGFNSSKPYAQLNARVVPFVKKYMKAEGARYKKMKVWGKRYFDMYDKVLSSYGLPKELKYLSVVESGLKSKAVSGAGASGPWQIMKEEAVRMGLQVNAKVDERMNFKKSTHAASKLLKELQKQFDDWILVIAAYNCGAGRVRKAIRKSGSSNFWVLNRYLPLETRSHVKRFIATHYIFEGAGLATMTATETKEYNSKVLAMRSKQQGVGSDISVGQVQ